MAEASSSHEADDTGGMSEWLTIGIMGGLGPYAHIDFEHRLLAAVADARRDQDYPPWILSSLPATPDRTACLLDGGPSPAPALRESLRRIAPVADFAVIPCNTAHAFLDALRGPGLPPILSIVDESVRAAVEAVGAQGRVGLMGTSGTLKSGLYPRRARALAPDLEWVTLLDLPDGEAAQVELTMRPIYGPPTAGGWAGGGIKAGTAADPKTGRAHHAALAEAVRRLAAAGAGCVVTACTEIPLALGRDPIDGTPLIDPLDVTARAAIAIACGRRPLPWRG